MAYHLPNESYWDSNCIKNLENLMSLFDWDAMEEYITKKRNTLQHDLE